MSRRSLGVGLKWGRVEAISGSLKWGRHVDVGGVGHSGKKLELRLELALGKLHRCWGGASEEPDSWEGASGTRMLLHPGTCLRLL